jgi:60 kDa SS-A/Ro ribonucleoprotein
LNDAGATGDLVIYVSDNMSWADFRRVPDSKPGFLAKLGVGTRATVMAEEWDRFRKRNPNAKLVLIDIQPYGSTQMHEGRDSGRSGACDRTDVLNVGGFSDAVFDVVSLFAKGELAAEHWVSVIKGVSLA